MNCSQLRGLVIGNVQSGKTANYIGLLSRAADAGYKYLIILASTTNDLREQTQKRVEEGFIGFTLFQDENDKKSYMRGGVGVGDGATDNFRHPNPGTTRADDFKKAKMQTFLHIGSENVKEPWVFIVKKNKSTLENLITWLRQQHRSSEDNKLFLIDDEADYASINTQYSKEKISTINRLIRDLYLMFPCRTYVGYTATPYANILIDRDANDDEHGEDLFPEHFIYTLSPSDSYFGADEIFADIDYEEEGGGKCKYVRFINDCEAPSKKDVAINVLPQTLKDAIHTFLIAATIWDMRRNGRHHNMTMLVNLSQFNVVQGQYRRLIDYYLEDSLKPAIQLYGALPASAAAQDSQVVRDLQQVWQYEYSGACEFTWEEVFAKLYANANRLHTALIHHKSADRLEYETDNERVIAIGGNRLSRGLTLDGLVVSYFARNSRTYDTLMQMSRWFGHRLGYEDLCRIWMTPESAGWCRYIADSTNDLVIDLIRMKRLGKTPREFGLKVRARPSTLMVTARNKMGAGELRRKINLDGKYIETYALLRSEEAVERNYRAADDLAAALVSGGYQHERYDDSDLLCDLAGDFKGGYLGELVTDVPVALVEQFISTFVNCDDAVAAKQENVLKHIGYCKDEGKLRWDVLFAASEGKRTKETFELFGEKLYYEQRSPGIAIDSKRLFVGRRNKVSTKYPERAGLDIAALQSVIHEYNNNYDKKPRPSFDYLCREARTRPLLVIHHLDMKFMGKGYENAKKGNARDGKLNPSFWPEDNHEPMIAWSISFPILNIEKETEYVFNKVALEGMYFGEDGPDEDTGDDEDDE